jgi:periplasmic protein TonB
MKKQLITILTLLVLCFSLSLSQDKKNDCRTTHKEWDVPPSMVNNPEIKYPEDAQKNKVEGAIWFKVTIDTNGIVKEAEIIKKDNITESMIKEAENAVKKYAFKPARAKGKVIECVVTIPIKFKLK